MRAAIASACLALALVASGCSNAAPGASAPGAATKVLAHVADPMTFLSHDPATVPGMLVTDRVGDYPPETGGAKYAADGVAIYYTASYYIEEDVYLDRVYRVADIGAEPELVLADTEKWGAAEQAKADTAVVDYMNSSGSDDEWVDRTLENQKALSVVDRSGREMKVTAVNNADGSCTLALVDAAGASALVFRHPGIKYGRTTFAELVADPEGFVVFSVLFDDDMLTWERLYRLDVTERTVVPLGAVHIGGWDYSPQRNTVVFNTSDDRDVSRVAEFPVLSRDATTEPTPGAPLSAESAVDVPDVVGRAKSEPAPAADPALWLRSDRSITEGPLVKFGGWDLGTVGFVEYAADQRGIFYFTEAREGYELYVERIHFAASVTAAPSVVTTQTGTLVSTQMPEADPGLRALVRRWEVPMPSALWATGASGERVGLVSYNDTNGACQLDIVDEDGTHTAILKRAAWEYDPARITRLAVDPEGFVVVGLEWPESMMQGVYGDIDQEYKGPQESWRGIEFLYRLDLDTRAMTPIGKVPVDGWAYSADRNTIAFYLETGDSGPIQFAEYRLPAR